MLVTHQDKNLFFKIIKKSYPDLHSTILTEVHKAYSNENLEHVVKIKQVFDAANINDRRLFIAVVFRFFHPSLYENDNKDIPLQRGLNKIIAEQLNYDKGGINSLTKQVRTWLKYDVCDLRTKTDAFYEKNFCNGKEY